MTFKQFKEYLKIKLMGRYYDPEIPLWSKRSAVHWVSTGFKYRHLTEEERVGWILHCMDSDDAAIRNGIVQVLKHEYPQYQKVMESPDKYRILVNFPLE